MSVRLSVFRVCVAPICLPHPFCPHVVCPERMAKDTFLVTFTKRLPSDKFKVRPNSGAAMTKAVRHCLRPHSLRARAGAGFRTDPNGVGRGHSLHTQEEVNICKPAPRHAQASARLRDPHVSHGTHATSARGESHGGGLEILAADFPFHRSRGGSPGCGG